MLNDSTRDWMIHHQIRPWNIFEPRVLDALAAVPRERFVPAAHRALAFAEIEIPLAHGQRMLKPVIEGKLLTLLNTDIEHTAVLVGTGSGFLAACLGRLVRAVTAIDRLEDLTAHARDAVTATGGRNIELLTADYREFEPAEPVDRVVVSGSLPQFEPRLLEWLKPDGQLLLTVGSLPMMRVERATRTGNEYSREGLFETVLPALETDPSPPGFRF